MHLLNSKPLNDLVLLFNKTIFRHYFLQRVARMVVD